MRILYLQRTKARTVDKPNILRNGKIFIQDYEKHEPSHTICKPDSIGIG